MSETAVGTRSRKRGKAPIQAEVQLGDWAPRGAAWAELDGRRITVDRGIPGERVEAVVRRQRGPWRGVAHRILAPSPRRVSAPCPYFHAGCGGCQWQHMSYEGQLETKLDLANRELARAGLSIRADRVHGMEEPWRYRRTAAIALGWEAGFRPRGRRGIVEVNDCLIAHEAIGRLAAELNVVLRAGELPNFHGKVWLDCTVVDGGEGPALQVVIQGIAGLTPEQNPELPDIALALAGLTAVASVAYRHRSGEVMPLIGPLLSTIHVAGVPLRVPAGAFFQTNVPMLERLIGRMHTFLPEQPIEHAADVYGGVGTFAFALAGRARRVTLVELDPQAVAAAEETVRATGLGAITCLSAHAERALPAMTGLGLAIVDPPRSGLDPAVIDALAGHQVPSIFYVSCAPASLARDLAAFQGLGYAIRTIELFDFYPQTYHVESLAVLER